MTLEDDFGHPRGEIEVCRSGRRWIARCWLPHFWIIENRIPTTDPFRDFWGRSRDRVIQRARYWRAKEMAPDPAWEVVEEAEAHANEGSG